jgi:sulfur carrier protein
MEISVNDKKFNVAEPASLLDALAVAGISSEGVATALNGDVVPADKRAATTLKEGDSILVIKPFYGG